MENTKVIAVIGLGYVGLPLAMEFGKRRSTVGFDLSAKKIQHYRDGVDPTGEVSAAQLRAAGRLRFTDDPADLADADYFVVAVPTPVDHAHNPDFRALAGASETVGRHMKKGAIVVFESTVYPVAASAEAYHEYGAALEDWDQLPRADAIVAAVPHREPLATPIGELQAKLTPRGCFIAIKSAFDTARLAQAGHGVWRL